MIYELFRPLVRVYIVVVILWVWVWMENENIFQCILSSFKYSLSLLTHPHPQLESEFPDWTRLTLLVPHVTRTVQAQPLSSVFPVSYPMFRYPGLVWSYPGSPLTPTVSVVPARTLEREGVLPNQKLEGEDEPAALEFWGEESLLTLL